MSFQALYSSESELAKQSSSVGGWVFATYTYPASDEASAEKMAVQIASGQTLGYMPKDFEIYASYIARIKEIDFSASGRCKATIAFPGLLFGTDIAGLLTLLFGKISFAPGICLCGVTADSFYLNALRGPVFGWEGIRQKVHVTSKSPLLMAILKPGLGPNDQVLADQFGELVGAGVHLVKDDEVRVDVSVEDARRRLGLVLKAGKGKGLYVTALNGLAFSLKDRALKLQSDGAQAFLVCPYTYGISVLQSLCDDPDIKVPIFAHPAFTGIMNSGSNGIHPGVSLGTLMRWAGADAVLYPSHYGSICLPKSDTQLIHNALLRGEGHLKASASVPSAGILPEFVAQIAKDFGHDVVVNAGTGMAKSGGGVAEGAKLFLSEIKRHYGV